MTHLPYILASYGLFSGIALVLGCGAAFRLKKARTRLAALDRTSPRPSGAAPSP
ncbi:hypothetical protein [Acetobacter indonesiensis]|uniref:hypothetical protein n=1 Tax=Acetobacter indonesiensis TaxID=104101 RepID=UPI0039EB1607